MSNKIITISREFGSAGRTIGKNVAEKLGIPCYDSEIVQQVAIKSGILAEKIADRGEDLSASGKFSSIFTLYNLYSNMSKDDIIWHAQVKVINELADKGPCVIVGRCADYILRERENLVRVFIYADMKSRADRIVSVYGEKADAPEKRLRDKDKKRAAYYKQYAEMEWGDHEHYDICLNSGKLGIDKCVEIISEL